MKELIAAKIKYLVVAGGAFPEGPAEAHIKADIRAARKAVRGMADADRRGGQ